MTSAAAAEPPARHELARNDPAHPPAGQRRVVIFDLDGTLSESEPGISGSLAYAFEQAGITVPDAVALRRAIGPNFVDVLPLLGVPDEHVEVVIGHYRTRYEDTGLFETRPYDGIVALLDRLTADGVVLAIATSKPERSARRVLEHLGLADRFAVIAGADPERNVYAKADVIAMVIEQLELAAEPDGSRPTVVMVGDRHHDIDGARVHGIDTVAVAWGYGDADEHTAAAAAAIATHPEHLAELLAAGF